MAIDIQPSGAVRKPATKDPRPQWSLRLTRRVDASDRRFFTEQLSLLLSTGVNLHTSLRMLKDQARHPEMGRLIADLLDEVSTGKQLSQALARHPRVFSTTYVNLIAAAEGGGYIPDVLDQLLDMESKRDQLNRTLYSALSYPMFLLVFALGVVVFVLVFVFPKFEDLFGSIADQLPVTTRFLLGVSHLLSQHWLVLGIGMVVGLLVISRFFQSEGGRRLLDQAQLRLPPLRGIFTQLYLLMSLRVLGLSLRNGVGILDSLHATRDIVRNRVFNGFIDEVEARVQNGEGVGRGFEAVGFMPPMVVEMIKTGEETGNLARVMGRLADHYERELTSRIETFSRMAEPLMLLVMGLVIGLLVSSLILPIFKLSRAVT